MGVDNMVFVTLAHKILEYQIRLHFLIGLPAIVGIWFPGDEAKPAPLAEEQGDWGFVLSTVVFLILNVILGVAIQPVIELIELGLGML